MTNTYEVGDLVEITTSTAFQDSAGSAFDPDTVTFQVTTPGSTATSYVYGTDAEVTKNGTGDYSCTVEVETVGTWPYYVKGETSGGVNRGAARGSFYVREAGV